MEKSHIQLPGYKILEVIHVSSRTSVYRGEQETTKRSVIIKTANAQYPPLNELIALKNQFAITQKIDHPHIIKSYALEPYGNIYALISEDIGGISVYDYAQSQPLALNMFLKIAIAVVKALEYLYNYKIIHKDIKPKNIIINPKTHQIKLTDFSISCLLPQEIVEIKKFNPLEGTLSYMSPEQTGRMNCGIDYRSDFYSLGVTFYELLTGRLPFISKNPLKLVHSHLAKMPPLPQEINPAIPDLLAEITIKLMSKSPENRYQTARGIRYDLERFQEILLNHGQIKSWQLGSRDIADRFIICDKVYGRDQEISILLDAFTRVSQGSKELMLVLGSSGIGKTAIVHEINQPILEQKGYFTAGKYEQLQNNIPVSALLKALGNLLQQVLTQSPEELVVWKNKILLTLGEQAQIIIDLIPELEKIIGPQPAASKLTSNAAQNRFNVLFAKFIQIFANEEHPLVIFLDDLQWADPTSLKLIQFLIKEPDTKYLLLIGAYRDHEVYSGHPLTVTLEDLQKVEPKIAINEIHLQPLDKNQLNLLISGNLACEEILSLSLTEFVFDQAQGNPFFSNQLIKSMYEDGLLSFDFQLGCWQCDIYRAQALYGNDILQLLATQIHKLPVATQEILKIAACIGNEFDLLTLAIACEKSQLEIESNLQNALTAELIITQDEKQNLYPEKSHNNHIKKYKFFHDRVQQAAYLLIPDNEKESTHWRLGKLIYEYTKNRDKKELEEKIFIIANQLNVAQTIIDTQGEVEKCQLAELNLIAGHKAKVSTAYEAAIKHLKFALKLLPVNSWQTHYHLTLNLYLEAVEVEFLNINFDQAEIYIKLVQEKAVTLLDQVPVYEIQIQIYMAKVQIKLAIETGIHIINMLGIQLVGESPKILNDQNQNYVDKLINLPVMTAPDKMAAMRILGNITTATYCFDLELFDRIVFTMIHLSLEYGNCSTSASGYAHYGLLLCRVAGNIDNGYRYGQLALNLANRFNAQEVKCVVLLTCNSNINFWKNHLQQTIASLSECINYGMETGDLEHVGYASAIYNQNKFLIGENLTCVLQELETHINLMYRFKQQGAVLVHLIWKQLVLELLNYDPSQSGCFHNSFDDTELLSILIQSKASTLIFTFYLAKTIFFYLFHNYQKSLEAVLQMTEHLNYVFTQIVCSQYNFYYSLVLLGECSQKSNANQENLEKYLQTVKVNQESMAIWARQCPENYQHKYDLIAAEMARVLSNHWQAGELYDQAIMGARKNRYIQEEALANELAARFYLNCGRNKIAQTYLIDAYYCYVNWGAKSKVIDLEISYPELLAPVIKPSTIIAEETNFMTKIMDSNKNVSAILDLETVTKASLAISSEIKIDKLLGTLLNVIVENTGAKKAALILKQESNLFTVVRENQNTGWELIPIKDSQDIPINIINYVNNTQNDILIDSNSIDKKFAIDPYIIKYQPKSILCNPILKHGQLMGIIYLENRLTTGAFTPERLKVLKLLSSQAAISLENAELYEKLEEKVAIRTKELNDNNLHLEKTLQELKSTQMQLIHTEKMSSLGQMVASIAHEINNPVNFIYANVDHAIDYIQYLLDLLNIYQQEYPTPHQIIVEKIKSIDFDFLVSDLPKVLNSMSVGAERIRDLVVSLRNFSRVDESEIKPLDIHQSIDSTLILLQPQFKEKLGPAKNIIVKNYSDLPLIICYASQLNQVFMNMISNAIDAIYEHRLTLSAAAKESFNGQIIISTSVINRDWVRVCIKDNGKGMSTEMKNRIFEPFFTTKPVGEGTGLGLSISYQIIVNQHRGKIHCLSQPGMGTEFVMEIPTDCSQYD
ncbi:trifunctional serine/threonine-protein kinase/ATP-binding protein/sensor histidine kinase [Cylindrospermopsis curvispora]|uniref:histidine kinase n=1 Tax=Cylindrospermopsis curvispora GIHE-G1 TaxID=2666332 RepID=A0A7H0EWE6_9CYAN|nr:ATP-binding sensor histidine kinase [Cylindrospermopsis curvispora]QNP28112.1 AAA family ATPase [Cylindrospermopsis curvispora GIHE-G1]